MAEPARPYTVERLAQHWECSADHIYDLVQEGKLRHFRVGRLIRIPRAEVERVEACGYNSTEGDGMPSGETPAERADAPWTPRTGGSPNSGSQTKSPQQHDHVTRRKKFSDPICWTAPPGLP